MPAGNVGAAESVEAVEIVVFAAENQVQAVEMMQLTAGTELVKVAGTVVVDIVVVAVKICLAGASVAAAVQDPAAS